MPYDAVGNALTPDGRYLLVAGGAGASGATVVNVALAEAGASNPVLGTLAEPHAPFRASGAIEVATSPSGRYVFVSLEAGNEVAVYDLDVAIASRFQKSGYVGSVPVGHEPVGLAESPNGRWLYATSQKVGDGVPGSGGTISVISTSEAEHHPRRAVVATAPAGCLPVRAIVSSNGAVVWVTAKGSNELLAFSAKRLRSNPTRALLATVHVGAAPVALALVAGGTKIIVADRGESELTAVSVAVALAHRPAVIGTIAAGVQPREMAVEPGGQTLLVDNYASDQLEAVDLDDLR